MQRRKWVWVIFALFLTIITLFFSLSFFKFFKRGTIVLSKLPLPQLDDNNIEFDFLPRSGITEEEAMKAIQESWWRMLAAKKGIVYSRFKRELSKEKVEKIEFDAPKVDKKEKPKVEKNYIYPLAPLVIKVHDKRNYDPTTSGAVAVTSAGAYIFNFSPEESRIVIYLDGATSDSPGVAEVDGFISAWLEGLNILWYGQASGLGTDEMVPNIDFLIDSLVYDRSGQVNPMIQNLSAVE